MLRVGSRRFFSSVGRPTLPPFRGGVFKHYLPGTPDAVGLKAACEKLRAQGPVEIPCIVGGKEIFSGNTVQQVCPSDHGHVLANVHMADAKTMASAVEESQKAKYEWETMDFMDRAMIWRKAADLMEGPRRFEIMAATMLGQGKNPWQAEIDAAVETIDFMRLNTNFAEKIYEVQPPLNSPNTFNQLQYRPLEGFVAAISPFNFTAIGANLPTSPALMGNTVLWKPATTASLSNYVFYKIMVEAGLPPGVINFLPSSGQDFSAGTLEHPEFAGLHFTGSTGVFNHLWGKTASNLDKYRGYPRIVGETGGKNFHFIHESVDNMDSVVNHTVRGAFEYQGQKCSATSRAYVPNTRMAEFKELITSKVAKIKMGQPDDFDVFMTAVIDAKSFDNVVSYIEHAKADPDCEIISGGGYDNSKGYFVEPTVIVTKNPKSKTMEEEIFGPVLTVYEYDSTKYEETLALCDETGPYALTGSIFCTDRLPLNQATHALRNSSGNFYINDKSTGAVVGEQPFGGARASGTNDKAGSHLNLLRWISARTIKETSVPCEEFQYPHQGF